jgi:hypothetical protein
VVRWRSDLTSTGRSRAPSGGDTRGQQSPPRRRGPSSGNRRVSIDDEDWHALGVDCLLYGSSCCHQDDLRALNKLICDAEGNREALLGLVERKGEGFNAVNMTTCLNR